MEEASGLYLWGFSAPDIAADREQVMLEARRIMPLLTQRDSARWQPLLEGDTRMLSMRIARYWLEHDPTPETALNERLVEHWQRIVEARERYQYNRSSVYETDDRGIIFVKYGPPDARSRGHLGSNEMELKIRVADALAREEDEALGPESAVRVGRRSARPDQPLGPEPLVRQQEPRRGACPILPRALLLPRPGDTRWALRPPVRRAGGTVG